MNEQREIRSARAFGPFGDPSTIEALPPPGTTHWVVSRKAAVLSAINCGLLSFVQACERYDLSLDELLLWQTAVERCGIQGLRVTKILRNKSAPAQQDNG